MKSEIFSKDYKIWFLILSKDLKLQKRSEAVGSMESMLWKDGPTINGLMKGYKTKEEGYKTNRKE